MERRIQKFNITGDLHEHLYEDAKRREERLIEYSNLVSPEVTFQPDIGSNKFRPMMDDGSIDGFFNRLMNAKLAKDQVIQQYVNHGTNQDGSGNGVSEQEAIALNAKFLASREAEREREREKELTFQPRVGRGPNFVRNEEKKPIGEFLYEVGSYVNKLKKEIVETKLDLENQERSRPKIGEVSKHVFEESKNRRLKELFLLLSEDVSANSNNASKSSKRSSKDSNNKNNDQSVGPSTNVKDSLITLQSLDFSKVNPEYHDLLKPVHAYLVETESSLDYEGFCLTMNFIIEKSGVPCGHLFVQNYEVRGPGIANVTITGSQRNLNHMTNDKELLAHYQNNSNQVQKLQLSNQLNARSQSPTANLAVNSNKHFSFGDGYRPFDPQCTFQPTISNRSRSLGKVKGRQQYQQQGQGGPATIYDRLYDKDKREEFQKRMKMLEKQKIESEMRECTFAPMKGISARKLEAQRIASQERGGGNGVNTGNSQQQSQQNQQNSYMSMNNNNNISRTNSGNNTARSRSNGPKVVPINYNLDGSLNNTMSTSGFGGFAPPNRSAHLDSGVTNTATSKAIQQVESVLAESQQQVARSKEIVDSLVNHHDSDFRVEADNSRRLKSAQMLTKKIENTMAVNSSSSTNGAMSSNGLNGTSAEIQMNQNQMSMTLKNQQIQNQNLNLNNTPDATQFESPRGGAYNSISPEQSPARQSTQGGGMNSARKSRPPSMGQ